MFKLYKKYLKNYKFHVFIGPLFKLIEVIFELLVPFVIRDMIDNVINNETLLESEKITMLLQRGGLLLIFAVLGLCSTLVTQFVASRASQGSGTLLRDDLYKHINTLSFKELDILDASTLITRMTSDINNFQQSVAMLIRLVVRAPFIVVGATIMSLIVSVKAGLIFLAAGFLMFIFIMFITVVLVPRNKLAQQGLDKVTEISKENLKGNRVVRAFSKQKYEFTRFVDSQKSLTNIQVKVGRLNALLSPLTFLIANVAAILILYVGGFSFLEGTMKQGDIQALINYLTQIELAIIALTNLVVIFTKAQASSKRINEVFEIKSSVIDGTLVEGDSTKPLFEFKNVSFKYNDLANYSLKDISFSINKGETIGIIGGTGSGKTTLVSLLNRFYDRTEGTILFEGHDIKDYKLQYINSNIATVMQKANLFSGTIKDNLVFGKDLVSDELLDKALKVSQSNEFVSKLENKLDSIVLQGGANFSGGQKQRLSIARALCKDSDILILDDSSSALDFKTESNLRKEISKLDKTTIIISQRASSIMHADLILVLDNGNLVGKGRHNELIKTCEVYKEICDSQDSLREAL